MAFAVSDCMDVNELYLEWAYVIVAVIHSRSVRFNKVLEVRQMSGSTFSVSVPLCDVQLDQILLTVIHTAVVDM